LQTCFHGLFCASVDKVKHSAIMIAMNLKCKVYLMIIKFDCSKVTKLSINTDVFFEK